MIADLRDALRGLRRAPATAIVIVVSLALAIAAASAVGTIADRIEWRPLAVKAPAALVSFSRTSKSRGRTTFWPYPTVETLRGLPQLEGLAATTQVGRAGLRVEGATEAEAGTLTVGLVSGNYFPLLGVRAERGRLLAPDDDAGAGARPVTVISDAWWASRFGRDPAILGRLLTLNATSYAVVGVAPASFAGDSVGMRIELWVPISHAPEVMIEKPTALSDPRSNWIRMIGRLQPGVSVEQARDAVAGRLEPDWTAAQRADVRINGLVASHGVSDQSDVLGRPIAILLAIVGVVLMLACANAAVLFLARMAAREQSIATRLALGARRGQILRLGLIEPLALTAIAGALGACLALWVARVMIALEASGRAPYGVDATLDTRFLALTAVVTIATGVLCGVLPALWTSRRSPSVLVKAGSPSSRGSSLWGGRALVILQMSLALALTASAGLFARTVRELNAQDVGFDRSRVLLFWMAPRDVGAQADALAPLFTQAPLRVAALPGVEVAGASSDGVLSGFVGIRQVDVPGRTLSGDPTAQWNLVGPGFLDAIGMRLIAGRDVRTTDSATAPPVAVVNEAMARYFFGTTDVMGRHFAFGSVPQVEVVGVVRDAKYFSLRDADTRMVFLPFQQDIAHLFRMCLVVRTSAPVSSPLVTEIRRELRAIDPSVPLGQVETIDQQVAATIVDERLVAWLSAGLAGVSLLLACLGVYALLAYTVARQAREMAVRSAIGASPAMVMRLVLGRSVWLIAAGLAIGVPVAVVAARAVRSFLFGVGPGDVTSFLVAAALLALAGIAGALVPARRAAMVDPLSTLRAE